MANQFATSQRAMLQLQENLVQEQNLFISLMGSVWRRVSVLPVSGSVCTPDFDMNILNIMCHYVCWRR